MSGHEITISFSEFELWRHIYFEAVGWLAHVLIVGIWIPKMVKNFLDDLRQSDFRP